MIILTATATKTTKEQILTTLHLTIEDVHLIEQSPDRPNIQYSVQYLEKNQHIETVFTSLLEDVKEHGARTPRTLIYCQTRKQCAVIGRAGRDGLPSSCSLLYNGLLLARCDKDMKMYVQAEECRRKLLMYNFGYQCNETLEELHTCDFCAKKCICQNEDCSVWNPCGDIDKLLEMPNDLSSNSPVNLQRAVSKEQRKHLHAELVELKQKIASQVCTQTMVSCPNNLLEFNNFHIKQVLKECHKLFSVSDIVREVEIWRHMYAIEILKIINSVFNDINVEELININVSECLDSTSSSSNWDDVRDDSTMLTFLDSQELEGVSSFAESNDESMNLDSDI